MIMIMTKGLRATYDTCRPGEESKLIQFRDISVMLAVKLSGYPYVVFCIPTLRTYYKKMGISGYPHLDSFFQNRIQ